MSTITFPSTVASDIRWGLSRNIVRQVSPLSRKLKRTELTGDQWVCDFTIPKLTGDDARLFRSFLMRASQFDNDFTAEDFSYVRKGTAGDSVTVSGASQTGYSINLAGSAVSQSVAVAAGDRFRLDTAQVVEAAADAASDGAGAVTVTLTTRIRTAPTNASAVDFTDPLVKFVLDEDTVSWLVSAPLIHDFKFSAIELL